MKRFDAGRGFGFVALSDGSPDAFFHISKLKGENVSPAPGFASASPPPRAVPR